MSIHVAKIGDSLAIILPSRPVFSTFISSLNMILGSLHNLHLKKTMVKSIFKMCYFLIIFTDFKFVKLDIIGDSCVF